MSSDESAERVPLIGSDGKPLGISGLVEATILAGLLVANGIDAKVSQPSRAFNELPVNLLLVPAGQARDAARIIDEARAQGESATDEAELAGEAAGDLPPDDLNCGSKGLL